MTKKINIEIDNNIYTVIYKPRLNNEKEIKFYRPLFIALWDILKKNDEINNIIHNHPYETNTKIINFNDILNLFSYNIQDSIDHNTNKDDDMQCSCLCGVFICHQHVIRSIKTNSKYIIGSECIGWWDNKKYNRLGNILKNNNNLKLSYCHFCFKKTKCMNCIKKQYINLIFDKWKYYLRCKLNKLIVVFNSLIKFGKYKNSKLIKLCQDNNYSNFILNNTFNDTIKTNIITYRKNKILLNKRLN